MSKLSILIATYNTEQYLPQCLDSLLAQTHEEWEAVCIDDCSTDGSLAILNDYASRDERFKVIHLDENQGQAKARNKGIAMCTGDIVCFLDSDDWFAPESVEKIVRCFEEHPKADSVLFKCIKVFPDGNKEEFINRSQFPLTGREAFERSLDWSIHGIYATRMDIQRKHPYDDTCRSFSDDNTTRLHYLASREVHQSDATYFYRQNPVSVSHQISIRRFDFLIANKHMQDMLREMGVDKSLLDLHERERWFNLLGCLRLFFKHKASFSKEEQSYVLSLMHTIWKDIDTSVLPVSVRFKPAYMPLRPFWHLFLLQEYLYCKLVGTSSRF
ncbi:MAG: glycosyltransferase family 2 protein [Bacteroidaceae bacterium]|nr:glycosyltransferase family 2 protein [Bacteroidaceae bacterium]